MLYPETREKVCDYFRSIDMSKVRFVNIGEYDGHPRQLVAKHSHTDLEILYHTAGKGLINYGDKKEQVRAYDIAVIPPNAVHAEASDAVFHKALIWLRVRVPLSIKLDSAFTITDSGGSIKSDFEMLLKESRLGQAHSREICQLRTLIIMRQLQQMAARTPEHDDAAQWLRSYLFHHYSEPILIGSLAKSMGFSTSHLVTLFKKRIGISPGRYLINRRLTMAKLLLISTSDPINLLSPKVGMDDPLYFSRMFKKETEMTPTQYRMAFKAADVPDPPSYEDLPPPGCDI